VTIIWSRQAQDDLSAIRTFIARDSERYAQLTIDRIIAATDQLLNFPRSGRVVPEVGDDNLRELLVGFYRVVYRLQEPSIGIATVVHMSRELHPPEGAA
jgi:plasmid stabilization system protein ParE